MAFEDFFVYKYKVEETKTPFEVYGGYVREFYENWKSEIVDFRPPKEGERVISWTDGEADIAPMDYEEGNCRFILKPLPKLLKKFLVEVWDVPPTIGDMYVCAPTTNENLLTIRCGRQDRGYALFKKAVVTEVSVNE